MSAVAGARPQAALVVGRPTRDGGQSEAARRILAAAAPLFHDAGVRAVAADAVIDAAGVTKATFYRHFPTKDHLVVAYLHAVSAAERSTVATWREEHADEPLAVLTRYGRALGAQTCGPDFRGCPFLNAIAAYPDPSHPVRVAAEEHRSWLRTQATELLAQAGATDPALVATQLLMLRDGAMAAGDEATSQSVTDALIGAGTAVVRSGLPTG